MPFARPEGTPFVTSVGRAINRLWLADETEVLRELLPLARLPDAERARVRQISVNGVVKDWSSSEERIRFSGESQPGKALHWNILLRPES